ncbi:MAG: 23S rRNA (uracil(1939)-C(5))-methyltransferase RlmD [Chlamydiales bacterium]
MKQRDFDVIIEGLDQKGFGQGKVFIDHREVSLSVPYTLPNEKVHVQLQGKKKGKWIAHVDQIHVLNQERTSPRCVHFGECGGCVWQHINYQEQLRQKEAYVHQLFRDLLHASTKIHPIIPSQQEWEYRNKMEFSFSQDANLNRYLGLIKLNSRGRVLNLSECHLVHDWFIEALKHTSEWWQNSRLTAYNPHRNEGTLRTLTVREGWNSGDRLIMLTVSGNPEDSIKRAEIDAFTKAMRQAVEPESVSGAYLSVFLRIQQSIKGQQTQFYEMHLHGQEGIREELSIAGRNIKFMISPSAFFQPHPQQAERIFTKAIELANVPSEAVVYDLYCGTGTFGLCIAPQVQEVYGIELSYESVVDARENVKLNGITNMHIDRGDVEKVLDAKMQSSSFRFPDLVFIDPPRSGLTMKAIQQILRLNPQTIVYVSCNPKTQAENIAQFIEKGYILSDINPIDQFPQTVHCENIAILRR